MSPVKTLLCVVGPTAIGKTSMGIALAEKLGTEIISADSRQFYKEMSIGTAVPSEEELSIVKHHFIQHISISDSYNVGDFEKDALKKLEELFAKQDFAVMVGGSGLYVDAVTKGLDEFPEVDQHIRKQLQEELESDGLESLCEELSKRDPVTYDEIDLSNPQRVIRALEICRGSGQPFSSYKGKRKQQRSFRSIYIGLTADRETVYERINLRVDLMMELGLEAEAKGLQEYAHLNALQTVGYKELFASFDGKFSRAEAVSEIKKNSRRFAKRQGTWFRKNEQIHWFDHTTSADIILSSLSIKKGR